jgi:hypothetical protein
VVLSAFGLGSFATKNRLFYLIDLLITQFMNLLLITPVTYLGSNYHT